MKKITFFLLVAMMVIPFNKALSCTSAIISGKLTPDGRPLLFKHRDTGELNNRIEYFKGEKYNFFALVNSPVEGGEAWCGNNNVGFCIINTASYNLKDDDIPDKMMDKEGVIMYQALSVCRNLKDFEKLLNKLPKPLGVEANFGVIDAEGGAAYYEVNNSKWTKLDVNDPKIAPFGYLVVTNFSYTGRFAKGSGYERYYSAEKIVSEKAKTGNITPRWIFNALSRSFYNSAIDIDLKKDMANMGGNGWFIDKDFIPRRITSASVVFQGVSPEESGDNTIMWTVLGYPPLGVAIPLFVKYPETLPSYMIKGETSKNALLCDMNLQLKKRVFSLKIGNKNDYFHFTAMYNKKGDGYAQILNRSENQCYPLYKEIIPKVRKGEATKEDLSNMYEKAFEIIQKGYKKCR